MHATAGTSKRTDALLNRARLLEVARSLFVEVGLDLEVNDVISRAQLGVGTFYRHFGSREDLLRAIVLQALADARTQILQAIEPHMHDPRTALQELVSAQFQVYQHYHLLFATMRDRRLSKLFDSAQREELQALVLDPARRVLEQGIHAGLFRPDLPLDLTAALIIGSFTSIFDLLGSTDSSVALEQQCFQLLLAMLT
jgi:AcrR family transcriptional regulator